MAQQGADCLCPLQTLKVYGEKIIVNFNLTRLLCVLMIGWENRFCINFVIRGALATFHVICMCFTLSWNPTSLWMIGISHKSIYFFIWINPDFYRKLSPFSQKPLLCCCTSKDLKERKKNLVYVIEALSEWWNSSVMSLMQKKRVWSMQIRKRTSWSTYFIFLLRHL